MSAMTSLSFFALVGAAFLLNYIFFKAIKNEKSAVLASNIVLLVLSYLFVIYADYRFALVLFGLTLVTWLCAKKTKLVPLGIILSLCSLAFFKYTNFFIESFSKIFGNDYNALHIILPLGISFYTFSAISYLVDVKRGKVEAQGLLNVALYLSFFPKLTSGPIQRSGDFIRQANSKREIGVKTLSPGFQIFVFGLFKKLVLADRLSVFVNQVFENPNAFGSFTLFLGAIAYALQIYMDFSGYSDMAIGVAKILGFDFPRNFNLPYIAHNVTELWKRWHMTLSSWLMDYLYIPLGGSRKGKVRTYINLILTMVIGGIWHGANWTYVIWGLLHGIALAIHKVWMTVTKSKEKAGHIVGTIISILLTFLFTTFCWIFFRSDSISSAWTYICGMFSFRSGLEQPYLWLFVDIALVAGCTIVAAVRSKKNGAMTKYKNTSFVDGFYPILNLSKFWSLVIFFVFVGMILCFAYTGGSPFIYGNY